VNQGGQDGSCCMLYCIRPRMYTRNTRVRACVSPPTVCASRSRDSCAHALSSSGSHAPCAIFGYIGIVAYIVGYIGRDSCAHAPWSSGSHAPPYNPCHLGLQLPQ
jgi:hypothetical protein